MKPLRVNDLYLLYLNHAKARNLHSEDRARARDIIWRLFLAAHGNMLIEGDLEPYHLTEFIEGNPTWKSGSTRKFVCDLLKAPFTWGAKFRRINRSPFACISYQPEETRPAMPDAVLDAVLDASSVKSERILQFMRMTGCRPSEACRARWEDIDWVKGVWTIPRHKRVKWTHKPRGHAMVAEAVDLLKVLRDVAVTRDGEAEGLIFRNTRGGAWTPSALYQVVLRAKKRCGITDESSPHGIRKRFATASCAAGAAPILVAHQIGDTLQTVERYYVQLAGETELLRNAAALGMPRRA